MGYKILKGAMVGILLGVCGGILLTVCCTLQEVGVSVMSSVCFVREI